MLLVSDTCESCPRPTPASRRTGWISYCKVCVCPSVYLSARPSILLSVRASIFDEFYLFIYHIYLFFDINVCLYILYCNSEEGLCRNINTMMSLSPTKDLLSGLTLSVLIFVKNRLLNPQTI